jgi:predicted RNA binding protein YcfA (HicA-like mRNA interferase family)
MLRDSRDIIRRLTNEGFELKSTRGSHRKFVHPTSRRVVIAHQIKGRITTLIRRNASNLIDPPEDLSSSQCVTDDHYRSKSNLSEARSVLNCRFD